jgi:hypothetical protein
MQELRGDEQPESLSHYLKSATFSSDLCSVSYICGAVLSSILMTPGHMHSFLRIFPVRRATSVLNQHNRVSVSIHQHLQLHLPSADRQCMLLFNDDQV